MKFPPELPPGSAAAASFVPSKSMGLMAVAGALGYIAVAWSKGFHLLDNDTLSQILAWRLIFDGQILQPWSIATPKFLQIVIDGPIADVLGPWAVTLRSIVVSVAAALLGALVVKPHWGTWPAVSVFWLLVLNRSFLVLTLSANSTVLFCALIVAAMWLWARGSKPEHAVIALGLAAACRIEGVFFLAAVGGLCCCLWWRSPERRFLTATALTLVYIVLALGVDTVAPSLLSGRFRTNAEITKAIDESETRKAERELARGNELAYELARFAETKGSYASQIFSLVPRLLRPWQLYLLGSIIGAAIWWQRLPALTTVLVLLGLIPLVYCAVLHAMGYALFDRFYLPLLYPAVVLTVGALYRLSEMRPRAAKLGAVTVGILLLTVNARDVYFSYRGYLSESSKARGELKLALGELRKISLTDVHLVLPENYWLPANLSLPIRISQARRSGVFFEGGEGPADLGRIDIVVISRAEGWYPNSRRSLEQAGFAIDWEAPENRFEIWRPEGR